MPPPFVFQTRNRRPPKDPVNVILSIGYMMAHLEAVRAAALAGLDPAIGVYQQTGRNRDSLACDLVESARPLVEAWVIRLASSGDIGTREFSTGREGCTLLKAGRRIVYASFESEALPLVRARLALETAALARALREHAVRRPEMAALPALPDDAGGDGA